MDANIDGRPISDLIREIPIVTRLLCGTSLFLTLAAGFGLVSPYAFFLRWRLLEFWRPITSLLFLGRFSLSFALLLSNFFRFSSSLETESFAGQTVDYLFFCCFGATLTLAAATLLHSPFSAAAFVSFLCYVWSRRNPDTRLRLFAGIVYSAKYLPFVHIALSALEGGGKDAVALPLIGMGIGHLYWYLEDVLPHLPGSPPGCPLDKPRAAFRALGGLVGRVSSAISGRRYWHRAGPARVIDASAAGRTFVSRAGTRAAPEHPAPEAAHAPAFAGRARRFDEAVADTTTHE
jgi:Derlin-2/3|eukprot:gnl/Ergobibamus_cyprinoides/327.p1 GENE.gnl/Ergobibamus_cyprinoides/327~~gnl/Ergobibamus_cyprinoides/327.p1  ORF type:complete len:291 (+),score=64.28 gnl/Ergobibamus_cyprinoides/327:50-922(+)